MIVSLFESARTMELAAIMMTEVELHGLSHTPIRRAANGRTRYVSRVDNLGIDIWIEGDRPIGSCKKSRLRFDAADFGLPLLDRDNNHADHAQEKIGNLDPDRRVAASHWAYGISSGAPTIAAVAISANRASMGAVLQGSSLRPPYACFKIERHDGDEGRCSPATCRGEKRRRKCRETSCATSE